jgi:putative intracellular protease/amidase
MLTRDVYLFVFNTMADWEGSFAIAGINNPRFQKSPGRYRVVSVGASREPVTTMGGMRVIPDMTVMDVDLAEAAMLILPGGDQWDGGGNREAIELARAFFVEGVPIAAICGATQALACARMLDDFHHTSNSREYLAATRYRGGKFYCDVPAIADEGMITASGTAPLEFAREIFRVLDVYPESALDAWYALFKLGDASRYLELTQCTAG